MSGILSMPAPPITRTRGSRATLAVSFARARDTQSALASFLAIDTPSSKRVHRLAGETLSRLPSIMGQLEATMEATLSRSSPDGAFPFADGAFDGVQSIFFIEETLTPRRALREMAREIRQRGSFRAAVLSLSGETAADYVFQRQARIRGFGFPRVEELRQMVLDLPYREVQVELVREESGLNHIAVELARRFSAPAPSVQIAMVSALRLDGA